jgi:CubicO group peptidase (beta-lactamase class C family)
LNHFYRFIAGLLIAGLIVSCSGPASSSSSAQPEPAYWPTDGWRSSPPEEQGMDSSVLASMFDHIAEQQLNLRSVLIVRNGYLVTEAYFHPYTAETFHTIESITKSVIDALIGIAIDQKYIKDADQSLLSFYPPDRHVDNLDANKQAIKLKDLLGLTTGFACDDAPSSNNRTMTQSGNWVAFMLNSPMAAAPGTTFNYCSGAAHVLSDVLQRSVNMSAREYANEQLFKPLGIAAVPPERWGADPQGVSTGGFGLYLTPRDVAKLGLLYLNNGRWDDKQIVPAEWVAASTTQHATKEDGTGYGYLWTVYPNEDRYAALGLAGQQLHVLPKQNLVVVFTSGLPVYGEAPQLNDLLKTYILPAAKSNTALPANPASVARLTADIQAAANPKQPVPELPLLARSISGKTYLMDDNPLGWQTMTFDFQAGPDIATVTIENGQVSQQEDIGLDNLYRETPGTGGLRGRWENDNTFIAEQIQPGQIVEYEYRLVFTGNNLTIELRERVFGGEPVLVQATLKD